jgi:predicted nuclease of predicted toxin-antitoxin system
VKFLLDANLSPALIAPLREAGHEVVHVADIGLLTATDDLIFSRAADEGYTVITADSDSP